MTKTRVAILGGGVAALSAAYQMSKTEALRTQYDITIYQMGWRLGGKGATGRDEQGRILEHGLHIWFGDYTNAFRMTKDVYAAWNPGPDNALQTWQDALKPHDFTPLGVGSADGQPIYWPLTWSRLGGEVGEEHLLPTPLEAVESLVGLMVDVIRHWDEFHSLIVNGKFVEGQRVEGLSIDEAELPGLFGRYGHALRQWASDQIEHIERAAGLAAGAALHGAAEVAETAKRWIATVRTADASETDRNSHLDGIADLLHKLDALVAEKIASEKARISVISDWLTFAIPLARGVIRDFIIAGKSANEVDEEEFTDWLARHGGNREKLEHCSTLRTVYDACMQFRDGDSHLPDYGAGIGAQLCMRVMVTCKEAVVWLMQAGMGEVIVTPLYQVLQDRGVKVEFFRRTERLELSADKSEVARIHLARQVDLVPGVERYDPLIVVPVEGGSKHLLCWPAQPKWDQIVDGRAKAAVLDEYRSSLESHWCPVPPVGIDVLEQGRDFDVAILAISVGAFKKMNDEPSLAQELIDASPAFAAMTEHFGLVPSQVMQLWCGPDLHGLGWEPDRPAAVTGPEPYSVWADMSQTLKYEPWFTEPGKPPGSVHYLCAVWGTEMFKQPSTNLAVPQAAHQEVTANSLAWTNRYAPHMWPAAVTGDGNFDYDVLYDPKGGKGAERFVAQFIRANVDPTECLPASRAGTTKYRLRADESGFRNLILAGCWINSGFNTSCVETATMSGMQAARAICGEPVRVPGEFFMQGKRP